MIIVTREGVTDEELDQIRERIESLGLRTHVSRGESRTIVGCIGDEERLQGVSLLGLPGVETVHPVMRPYRLAAREFTAGGTRIPLGEAEVGGEEVIVIAGPSAVEGRDMLLETACRIKGAGARALRGGASGAHSSPFAARGMESEGLELLAEARRTAGLPVVTEVTDARQVDMVAGHADVLQVGARNMQNFTLLSEIGRIHRPVLLERGPASTVKELLLAADYVMKQGNMQVILCERGIRTFETATRHTFDLGAIPVLKRETHLPVIADPSHAAGDRRIVPSLSFAAIAAGADGLIVEVHPNPEEAFSDGEQSLDFEEFERMMAQLDLFARAAGRKLNRPS